MQGETSTVHSRIDTREEKDPVRANVGHSLQGFVDAALLKSTVGPEQPHVIFISPPPMGNFAAEIEVAEADAIGLVPRSFHDGADLVAQFVRNGLVYIQRENPVIASFRDSRIPLRGDRSSAGINHLSPRFTGEFPRAVLGASVRNDNLVGPTEGFHGSTNAGSLIESRDNHRYANCGPWDCEGIQIDRCGQTRS